MLYRPHNVPPPRDQTTTLGDRTEYRPDPEATADAELGALVRRMPEGWGLVHAPPFTVAAVASLSPWQVEGTACELLARGATPEAALREALEEEVPK